MAEKIIMLACSAGMSTSLLVSKMEAAAKQDGVDYKIFATSAADIDHQLSQRSASRCLVIRTTSSLHGEWREEEDW